MRRTRFVPATAAGFGLILAISACTNPYDPGQRALGGAAIGAGTGAAIGALAGGGRGAATGALIGGAVGAVGGVATTPPPPSSQGYPPMAEGYAYPPEPAYAPEMVWLPAPGAYVAMDYSYPLFFYGGIYYYLFNGYWYSGPSYRGPWRPHVAPPPPLRNFQPRYWNQYQTRARDNYRADPRWRHFRSR